MNIYKLGNLDLSSGGKVYGLSKLINCNINVPKGIVLQNTNNMTQNDIKKVLEEIKAYDKNIKFAVRSSCDIEDGKISSYAGIFETVLNVKNNEKDISDAIKKVNNSLNSEIVKKYSNKSNIQMNIIIEEMINSKISGICFTNAIDTNGDKVCLIEYADGLGEKIVSGKVNSKKIIVNYKNNILDNSKYKNNIIIYTLINYLNIAIKNFDYDLDIEWCADKDDNVYLLQARPITKNIFIQNKEDNTTGFVASRGYAHAETYVIDTNTSYENVQKQINEFEEGKILVTDYTETYFLPAMKKCSGIITSTGSVLCHAAIVSRELGIPAIIGYKNATQKFKSGTKIILDANNNQIILDGKKIKSDNQVQIDFENLDCFDDYEKVIIDDKKVFIDKIYDRIYIQKPNNLKKETYDKIEMYVRKKYKVSPKYNEDENKYLWIMEVERFKQLPFFLKYYNRIIKDSKEFNDEDLSIIQKELISLVKKLLKHKQDNKLINAFIDESIASINELLDGIIPFGYPLLYSYIESKELLNKYNLTFNDLFIKDFSDLKLIKIKKFLKMVEFIKDNSYQSVWNEGGVDPDYYEKRDDYIIKAFKVKDMDEFYDKYLNEYIEFYEREFN